MIDPSGTPETAEAGPPTVSAEAAPRLDAGGPRDAVQSPALSAEPPRLETRKAASPSDVAAPIAAPPAVVAMTRPASPPPAEATPPSPEKAAELLRRGDALLRQGDIVAARLFYERAVAAGSGQAATRMGKTYDPLFLATLNARGTKGDIARAIEWYRRGAAEFGDAEAEERLRALR